MYSSTTRVLSRRVFGQLLVVSLVVAGVAGCQSAPKQAAPGTARVTTAPKQVASAPFRVMTYNIHHGAGLDGKVDLPRIAALIKHERADIVALQEVDKGVTRTAKRDCPAELAALTGMSCVFSNNLHFQGGEYGNAVLTRFPIKRSANRHFKMLNPGEQRGLLQVVLDVHGRELVFLDTHADARSEDAERVYSAAEMVEAIQPYRGRPMILCGDFNDTPGSRTYQALAKEFMDSWMVAGVGDGFTIPAEKPRKRIDYLWVSTNPAIETLKVWVPQSDASDHLPVVGEFRLR